MDKTQKIIVVLLILAIVFSAFSMIIGFSSLNIKIPFAQRNNQVVIREDAGFGSVGFFVEGNNAPPGGAG